jgi:hypothetical protein
MNAPQSPYERFMSRLPRESQSPGGAPSWPLYERLKAEFQRDCVNVTPAQYEQAMIAIAEAAGV